VKITAIAADLAAEQDALDRVVAPLGSDAWNRDTPSPRWTVAHQIGHLAYFDHAAAVAITDPAAFADMRSQLLVLMGEGEEAVDEATLRPYLEMPSSGLLAAWRERRGELAEAAATLGDDSRVEWYGPSMSGKSFLTARLMECWAHGQDVVDAVGGTRPGTERLRHIAQLGFITRDWSYINRGLNPPSEPMVVRLTGPDGDEWSFGPADAAESVSGPAEDFCLVVTQRRHLDDTALVVGPAGRDWLEKAQAFAGPATDGPPTGGRGIPA
jgi:uncharacterized protein (TIGR03084 family)